MTPILRQRGSTLMVALVMLVLLTLIAISAISSTSSSIQVVGNAQFREEAISAGQRALEEVLRNGNFRTTAPAPTSIDINLDGTMDYNVSFEPPPACISYLVASDQDPAVPNICKSTVGATCYWTVWDITAQVSDIVTGASVVVHQGVRTIAGWETAVNQCGI